MAEYRASIHIEAPPDAVFEFLVTDHGVTAWMGHWAALDARVDGAFAVDIAGYAIRGRFLEVDRPRRVTVSWGVAGSELPPGASTVTFELTAIDGGTRVDLLHAGLPAISVDGHADGWAHFLPRLRKVATGGDPGVDDWTPSAAPTVEDASEGAHMPSIDPDPVTVVDAYHRAWTSGAVDEAITNLADDVRLYAPDENVVTKEDWREYLASFVPMLTGAPEHARMTDGERVALWYFPQTAVTSTTLASELFTVHDGRIVEIRLAFDRLGYTPPEHRPA